MDWLRLTLALGFVAVLTGFGLCYGTDWGGVCFFVGCLIAWTACRDAADRDGKVEVALADKGEGGEQDDAEEKPA